MENIILVGFGGHAKSVADCIERGKKYRIIGYTDMERQESRYSYLGRDDILRKIYDQGAKNAVLSVGYMGKDDLRERLYRRLKDIGFHLPIIADPSAIISENAEIGEGTFIGKGVIINSAAQVGRMCIINTNALVEHECYIDDFAHVAVGAVLCGQVRIGRSAFIGANATVIQCMEIPDRDLVPAGEVVRKNRMNQV